MARIIAAVVLLASAFGALLTEATLGPWLDSAVPAEARVVALLAAMTLQDKISQLNTDSLGLEHLGVQPFNWWGECLHGFKEDDSSKRGATIYPMPLVMASTFDPALVAAIASEIGDEARAVNNEEVQASGMQRAVNCFGPTINIFRDPRWGRGAESYGEDPVLASRMAEEFVRALQGGDSDRVKVAATCKHYAAYSMEEANGVSRHEFNAMINPRDWVDTYSPAFHACVTGGSAASVMCSYNAVNGVPSCASQQLLEDGLRNGWGFGGMVVSDCEAVQGVHEWHSYASDEFQGAAVALKAGTDLSCGPEYSLYMEEAIRMGYATEGDVDKAVQRVLTLRARLGLLDPPGSDAWAALDPTATVGNAQHLATAVRTVQQGSVLLKNDGNSLPLDGPALRASGGVVVVGHFANTPEYLLGNYYGYPAGHVTTPLEALREALDDTDGTRVKHVQGPAPYDDEPVDIDEVVAACQSASLCMFFVGSSMVDWMLPAAGKVDPGTGSVPRFFNEGERNDRTSLKLPGTQEKGILAVAERTDTPIVVVLVHGGPLDVSALQNSPRVGGILSAGQPGQGAQGIVDLLMGQVSPSGRLPTTWYYNSYTQQSDPLSMDMRAWPGRTYRFVQVPVLYPFGYGLSYTTFNYKNLHASAVAGGCALTASLTVSNTGDTTSDDVILLYASNAAALRVFEAAGQWHLPSKALVAFQRAPALGPGEERQVEMQVTVSALMDTAAGGLAFFGGASDPTIGSGGGPVPGSALADVEASLRDPAQWTLEVCDGRATTGLPAGINLGGCA